MSTLRGVPRALNRHCNLCGELMIEKEERSNFHHGYIKIIMTSLKICLLSS